MDYDVFISHGMDDRATAEVIAARLSGDGIKATRGRGNLLRSRALLIVVTASVHGAEASAIERQINRFQQSGGPPREILCLRVENAIVWDGINHLPALPWSPTDAETHPELLRICGKPTGAPADSSNAEMSKP